MDVVVKSSKKHWLWVFAWKFFKKWEVVIKWDISDEISAEEEKSLSREDKKYACLLGGKFIRMKAPACYVNHSCEANTIAENFCDIAINDIEIGQEITANYNEVSSWWPVIDCNCWSMHCIWKIFT